MTISTDFCRAMPPAEHYIARAWRLQQWTKRETAHSNSQPYLKTELLPHFVLQITTWPLDEICIFEIYLVKYKRRIVDKIDEGWYLSFCSTFDMLRSWGKGESRFC